MDHPQHTLVIAEADTGRRLDQVLAEQLPDYSRSRLKTWILGGQVQLDGGQPEPRTRVVAGQTVTLRIAAETGFASPAAEPMALRVVFEDDALLVIDKPAGLVVHPGAGNASGTLQNGLLAYLPALAGIPRSGLLHRLDKDTSGLLVVAKTLEAHSHLVRALAARDISREYRAVCVGRMTAGGTVDAALARHRSERTRMAVAVGGRAAVTHYRVLERFAHHTFVAVRLETGRTHQIRVHLAHVRYPLVGDPAYGGRLIVPAGASALLASTLRGFRRQALHASRLGLEHPLTRQALEFSAPLPEDFRGLLAALGGPAVDVDRLAALPWPAQAGLRP
jgi:23S rRNA pseudouridine1911/1915/1917 synthase